MAPQQCLQEGTRVFLISIRWELEEREKGSHEANDTASKRKGEVIVSGRMKAKETAGDEGEGQWG